MFCSSCGSQLVADSAFCANCGASKQGLSETAHSAAAASPIAGASKFLKTKNGRIVAIAAGVVVLGVLIFNLSGAGGPNLSAALSSCGLSSSDDGVTLGDGGKSLFLDGEGESEYSGMANSDEWCVLDALNVPEIVTTQMENTTSLMGVQDADWNGLHAEWTYHPDNGFEVSIAKN